MNSNKFYEGYEKLRTVGQGAFGTAILYRRKHDGLHVVMKEVYTMNMDNSEKRAALNEVEILSTLDHPNIITYIGSFQNEESLIIIMEYADGGNLAQLISTKKNKNEMFGEQSILNILSQITSGMVYMHAKKILHRDLKTANIFLNMNGGVKIGDFGISKMLNTRSQAQTVVGTPYYLSPEMCEGSDYNEKSDIWAIGCILYELASLKKPFEAATLPVLVQKISICQYDDIPKIYSEELSDLIRSILQKGADLRPTAKFINEMAIPKALKKIQATTWVAFDFLKPKDRSVLYEMSDFGDDPKIIPIELPHKTIIDFSVSATHKIAVLSDNNVYVWGENDLGQLGLGDANSREKPTCAHTLQKTIIHCGAGNGFSIFLDENGGLLSCGDGSRGCLGHGDWNSINSPTTISALTDTKITQISCGDYHVAALSSEGRVFTWGSSKHGELGQGHNQHRCKPLVIILPDSPKIKSIYCGSNATILLTTSGKVLVTGSNQHGKLGISHQDQINVFTPLRNLKDKIKMVASGVSHTMMVTENGNLIGIGRNSEAQLGKGNVVTYEQPQSVTLKNKITMVACGRNFTVVGDSVNVLWFWGATYGKLLKSKEVTGSGTFTKKNNSVVPLVANLNNGDFNEEPREKIVKNPKSLLAFYSSKESVKVGNVVYLTRIDAQTSSIFILTHTTAPPPIKQFSNEFPSFAVDTRRTTGMPSVLTDLPNAPGLTK